MTDIMKLADDYASACADVREFLGANAGWDESDGAWIASKQARAALQLAIEAMQAESTSLKQIAELNAHIAIDLKAERDQLQSKLGDAIQSSAHWQHQFTELQAENERLSKLFQDDVRIKDIGFKPNLHMDFEGGPVRVMAECFADYFRQSEAENYIEMLLSSEDGLELVATIQRKSGKSPHQLRQQAEAERDQLQSQLDAMDKRDAVEAIRLSDTVEGSHPSFGVGVFATLDAVDIFYTAPKSLAPTTWQPASNPPPESAGEVLVRMADGRCEIAWPTYWHGSSNAFAQWTFRDPDEDEQPVEWMTIPAHGIGGTP